MAPMIPDRTSPTPPTRPISLDQPRPTSERHRNLYLGAPVLPQRDSNSSGGSPNHLLVLRDGGGSGDVGNSGINNTLTNPGLSPHHRLPHQPSSGTLNNLNVHNSSSKEEHRVLDSSLTAAEQVRLPTNSKSSKKLVNNNFTSSKNSKFSGKSPSDRSSQGDEIDKGAVVTSQPTKRSLLGGDNSGLVPAIDDNNGGKVKLAESTIVCPYCRKCRCEACATPRPLPSSWICSKSIQCGPEPLLDYVTCLCCVKALFYHCGKNHEPDGGVLCADKPCSCAPHRKFWRWGCMTAMSLVIPCLCLYWPCKGCIHVAEKTYQRYHSNGCTCRSEAEGSASAPGPQSPLSQDVEDHHRLIFRVP